MTDHPSTFRGGSNDGAFDWGDGAAIHLKAQADGVLHGLGAIHHGTLAQMVAMIAAMPPERRSDYVIEKSGDHQLGPAEIMDLAGRADFPSKG